MTYQIRSNYEQRVKLGYLVTFLSSMIAALFVIETEYLLYSMMGVILVFGFLYWNALTMLNMKIRLEEDGVNFEHPKLTKFVSKNDIEKLVLVKRNQRVVIAVLEFSEGGSVKLRGYGYMQFLCDGLEELVDNLETEEGFGKYIEYSL